MALDELLNALKLSRYEREARLGPALFVLLPTFLLAAVWMPDFWGFLGGFALVAFFAGAYLMMGHAREKGLEVEERLEGEMGARPSTQALRHDGPLLNPTTRERYHGSLGRLGLRIPTHAEQQADAVAADAAFASAVDRLLELTRGPRFPMLLDENINYGFRRNLRGLKSLALGVLALCLALDLAALALSMTGDHEKIAAAAGLAALYLVLILVWSTIVTDQFVLAASWKYVKRLLACCEHLDPANPIPERAP